MGSKSLTVPTIFTAIDRFSAPLRAMQSNMAGFGSAAQIGLARAERGFRGMMAPVTALTNKLRYFGFFSGFALVLLMRNVIKTFSEFEQANANLAAVIENPTRNQLRLLSEDAKRLGLTTAKSATEVVGLQTELAKAGYNGPQILKMSEAIVQGSIAMDASLEETTELASSMIATFAKFNVNLNITQIMDQMTLSTIDTLSSFRKLQVALPIAAANAAATGIPFAKLTAILGELFNAGIDASSAGTALRNILADSAKRGHTYTQDLDKINNALRKLKVAFKLFGKRGMTQGLILSMSEGAIATETFKLETESAGTAARVAATRLNTFEGSVTLLKSAYKGFILSIEDGIGKYAQMLTQLSKAARGVLLLATGNKIALDEFNKMDEATRSLSERMVFWITLLKNAVLGLIALKIAIVAARIAYAAYSIVLGITSALTLSSSLAMAGNTLAITAQTVALWLMNTATGALSTALNLLKFAMGPLGLAIAAVSLIVYHLWENWDKITSTFQTKGLIAGFDELADTIYFGLLADLKMVYELLQKIASFGQIVDNQALEKALDAGKGFPVQSIPGRTPWSREHPRPIINPERDRNNSLKERLMSGSNEPGPFNGKLSLDYTGPDLFRVTSKSDSLKVMPKVYSTMVRPNQ